MEEDSTEYSLDLQQFFDDLFPELLDITQGLEDDTSMATLIGTSGDRECWNLFRPSSPIKSFIANISD